MSDVLFKFFANGRHALPLAGERFLAISVDMASGTLVVTDPIQGFAKYELQDTQGRAHPKAIRIAVTDGGEQFQIGDVTFGREGLLVEYFPINGTKIDLQVVEFKPTAEGTATGNVPSYITEGHLGIRDIRDVGKGRADGHLGILDIRDVGRQRKVVYFFDMMPVLLSLEGNFLVAKTLRHEPTDPFGPWYIIS